MSATKTKQKGGKTAETTVKLLTIDETAAYLSMGRRTLQERMESRDIGFIKIGASVRFHPDDIEAFIERFRVKPIG